MKATRRGAISAMALAGLCARATPVGAAAPSRLETGRLETRLVPGPVALAALLPPNYDRASGLPLLLLLHGGNGDHSFLSRMRPVLEAAWTAGDLPPCVAATPDARRSMYLDYRDGSEKWETFIVAELIPHLRSAYGLSAAREKTVVCGVSMGGLGSLRLALKHPDLFGGVAALEAGIEPALKFDDVRPRNSFERGPRFMEERYGSPVDRAFWAANNPANIAIEARDRIRASGLSIYIEAGDMDMFHLDEGVEFLHRVLWDHEIAHEYRLVRGADHLGRSLAGRFGDSLRFLARRVLAPPPPDDSYAEGKRLVATLKRLAGVDDSGPRPRLPPTDL